METRPGTTERVQRRYARAAGFLFLWLIVTGLAGSLTISHITGSGTFAEIAPRVMASQRLYRVALCSELVETLSALVLGFCLYATLRPVDPLLAQLAMYWRMAESFIGFMGILFGFMKLRLYLEALPPDQPRGLMELMRQAGTASYNMGAACFSIGSILFFYLFLKSRYIPKILSAFGLLASVIVTLICFGSLIFPEYSGTLQYGWAPMAIAEVATGVWLLVFAIRLDARHDPQFA